MVKGDFRNETSIQWDVRRYVDVSNYVGPEHGANGMEPEVEIVLGLAGMEFFIAAHIVLYLALVAGMVLIMHQCFACY